MLLLLLLLQKVYNHELQKLDYASKQSSRAKKHYSLTLPVTGSPGDDGQDEADVGDDGGSVASVESAGTLVRLAVVGQCVWSVSRENKTTKKGGEG